MTSRLLRIAIATLFLAVVAPALAAAQATKAGVVTTLEGNVVATRGVGAAPVALKFKDDVFVDDRITTGDRSIARLLLGGKALVTIRERSTLTITEVPGRATVHLDSGKVAVAVARERMRPGETVEVRTPNAVAGVRGTVFIVDVSQATAQAGGPGAGAVTTQVVTLQGSVAVQFAGPSGSTPGTVLVGAGEFAMQTGATGPPRSGTLTPESRAAALSGLRPAIRGGDAASSEHVKEQVTQSTALALGVVFGESSPLVAPTAASLTRDVTIRTTTNVLNACTTDPTICAPKPSPSSPTPTVAGIPGTLGINDLAGHLVVHDPSLGTANPNPYVVSVSDSAVMTIPAGLPAPVVVPSDSLFAVTRGAAPALTALERPLLVAESELTVSAGNLLTVDDVLAALASAPLLSVNGAALDVSPCRGCPTGGLVVVSGEQRLLGAAGTVVDASDATITTRGDVIAVDQEAAIDGLTTQALVRLANSVLSARALLTVDSEATVVLNGPLLLSTATVGRTTVSSSDDLIAITAGGRLFANAPLGDTALIRSDHTDYDIGRGAIPFRHVFSAGGTTPDGTLASSALLMGPLLASRDDRFSVTAAMLEVASGSPAVPVTVVSTTTDPLLSFNGSRVTLGAAACGAGATACMASAQGTGSLVAINAFSSMTLHGPMATVSAPSAGWVMDALVSSFSGLGLTTSGDTHALFTFDGATAAPHTVTGAMFDVGGFAVTTADDDPDAPRVVLLGTDEPLQHAGTLYQGTGGAAMSTTNVLKIDTALVRAMAPLVDLVGAGTALTSAADAVLLAQRAKLTADIPADALVHLRDGATFTVASGSLVHVAGGSFARLNVGALVSLGGGSTISLLDGALVRVTGNSSFSLTGALVSFTDRNNTLVVNNTYRPTGFINGVPVYSALGGTAGFNITRTSANLFPGLGGSLNNAITINGAPLGPNATGSLLVITDGAASKIKVQ